MKIHAVDIAFSCCAAVVAVAVLFAWVKTGSPHEFDTRIPGLDGVPAELASGDGAGIDEPPPEPGEPVRGDGIPSDLKGEWTGFRGPNRDNLCDDGVSLAREWPPGGPPVLWRLTLGEGYASPAIRGGRAYLIDYDEQAQTDTMRCLSLDDGREIWRNSYPVLATRNHGISRTVPSLVGSHVISMGPRCHVACWDAESGVCDWLIDLAREHGATVPQWYTGQCPLVDQERLILAPCGEAMLIAVDHETGEVIWRSPNPRGWKMTHVSIMPMDFGGQRTYIYCGDGGVAGIAADDGALLWESKEWPVQFAHAPSPLALPDGRILLSSGYGSKTGALLLKLRQDGDQIVAEVENRLPPKQFNSEQQTPLLYDNHIIGVRKRGGGQLLCLDLEGNEIWNSGSDRFGHGPYMIADGLVFAMDNTGRLVMAEASTDGYQRLAECQVFEDGHDAWGPMALASGRLILREMTRMVCLDIAAH